LAGAARDDELQDGARLTGECGVELALDEAGIG
jgi:hypothetical protein